MSNPVSKFILSEIELYKEIYPSLKLITGDNFASDH